jgi:hypothetical protein
MNRSLSYAPTLAALVFMLLVVLSPSPSLAANQTCEMSGRSVFTADGAGAVAENTCPSGSGGGDGDSQDSTPEDRWATYCNTVSTYQTGNTVKIEQGTEITSGVSFNYYSTSFTGHVGTPATVEQITIPSGIRYFNHTITCQTPTGTTTQNVVLPEGAAPVSPIALRDEVRARIIIPNPTLAANPPLDDPTRFSVVKIPTWLWIDDPWEPITDTETRGGISVSVTATPTKVTWNTGDDSQLECPDAGIPWQRGAAEGSTNCSHTYTRSSADQPNAAYQLTATTQWVFTWTLNGTPQSPFGTYEPTTSTSHQVGEIQIVNR